MADIDMRKFWNSICTGRLLAKNQCQDGTVTLINWHDQYSWPKGDNCNFIC